MEIASVSGDVSQEEMSSPQAGELIVPQPSSPQLALMSSCRRTRPPVRPAGPIVEAVSLPESQPLFFGLEEVESKPPFIIGVSGGTASGKTSVCRMISSALGQPVAITNISLDSYYRGLTPKERESVSEYDFDHPDAFDWALLEEHVSALLKRETIRVPSYDFVTHMRCPPEEWTTVRQPDVVLLEGILMFYVASIRDLFDMKLFVDTDADTRLVRRIRRDIKHRGRDVEGVLFQYEKFVKPSFDNYVAPTKKFADVVIPRGADNVVAINLIAEHIKQRLIERQH